MKNLFVILLFSSSFLFSQTEIIIPGGIQDNAPSINNVLSDAINQLNNEGTISIMGDIYINNNFTVPEGIELNFFRGNKFIIANEIVLTLNCTIDARQYQIFDGDGDVLSQNTCTNIAYPEWFGAIGNGIADDTSAIIQTLNFSSQIKWDGIYYSSTNMVITDPCFNIHKLNLKNTSLIIDATNRKFRDNTIKNTAITFDKVNNDIVSGSIGLYLKRGENDCSSSIRDLLIENIRIQHCDYGIYGNKNDGHHSLGTIRLANSTLKYNNYSVYFEENSDGLHPDGTTLNQCDVETGNNAKPLEIINSINDISINDNVFYSNIKDVYMKSADGVLISNNTFFGGNSRFKTKSIHLDGNLSDQIKIHGNQIFEPQEEGIYIGRVKSFQLNNNNIVTTNALTKLSSKIKVITDGAPIESTISGNIIRRATTNGIEIDYKPENLGKLTQSIFVNSNVIYVKAHDTIFPPIGDPILLSEIDHYGIKYNGKYLYINGTNHALKEEKDEDNNTFYTEISNKDQFYDIERRNNFSKFPSNNILNKTIRFGNEAGDITATNVDLLKFNGKRYSHFIKIHCWRHGKEAIEKDNVNSATYLLLVSKTIGDREEIALISELGLAKLELNPNSWIPDNWPAFTFSISNNILSISHKNGNAINEEFSFEIIKIGNGRID